MNGSGEMRAAGSGHPAELGEIIGGYRLTSVLSQGGMGCVYKAEHARLGRIAAVKVLASHLAVDQTYLARFFREARIVNEVRHRNIIDIFDFVETENPRRVACIMEYVDGQTLRQALTPRRMSLAEVLDISLQLVSALEAVHSVGVIHRDLKPTNIILTGSEPALFVKVLDFGIAKVEELGAGDPKTASGTMLGTPAYMAPEQVASDEVSPATDVYALGELFYEMLTGRRVFLGSRSTVLKAKILGQLPQLVFPEGIGPVEKIRAFVETCLAQDPRRRPTLDAVRQTFSELSKEKVNDLGFDLIAPPTLSMRGTSRVTDKILVEPEPTHTLEWTGSDIISASTVPTGTRVAPTPEQDFMAPHFSATLVRGALTPARRTKKGLWIAAILGSATGAVIIYASLTGAGEPPVAKVEVTAPVESPRPAPPVESEPVKVEEPAPVPRETFTDVLVASVPTGAKIIEPETNRVLGSTPHTLRLLGAKRVELRMPGHLPRAIELSPARSVETITLTKKADPPKKAPAPAPLSEETMPSWEEP